jgi:cell division protease FtsH
MAVLLGGRAAEWIVFHHLSTGAADDLRRVTEIARAMVVQYGMSPDLGHVTYEKDQRGFLGGMALPAERAYADSTASTIDREVHDIAERAFTRAVAVLTERRILLDATARKLLAQETLEADDITAIAAEMKVPA